MASTTWPAVSMNGQPTGMTRNTTRRFPRSILTVQLMVRQKCSVADRIPIPRIVCDRPSVPKVTQQSMNPMSVSAAPKMRRPCPERAARPEHAVLALTNPLGFLLVPSYEGIDQSTQGATEDRRDPEKPELLKSPYICKDGGAGAACWVQG